MIQPSSTGRTTLLDSIQERVSTQGDQLAILFQRDNGTDKERWTYRDLDLHARMIAAQLQHLSIPQAERAILLYPQGLDYMGAFLGCLYAGIIAVPTPHPHLSGLSKHFHRLQTIIHDAQPSIALTTSSIFAKIEPMLPQFPVFQTIAWQTTDTLPLEIALTWRQPTLEPHTLAFLQYTSGSTSAPKGVMLSHANLLHNIESFQQVIQHPPGAAFVSWTPLFHDMGLIASALQALYMRAPFVLMSPQAFIQRPLRWLQAISDSKAHTSCAPNFAYDLCVQKISPEQRQSLDLSDWKFALNGSEPVQAQTLTRFTEAFAACGFRAENFSPGYGLAEATVYVSAVRKGQPAPTLSVESSALEQDHIQVAKSDADKQTRILVGCGIPGEGRNHRLVIVNPLTFRRCNPDQVGEIWIASESVAQGYWQHPQETEETFHAYLADTNDGPFLRTGDLGFLYDQQLYITGRLKDLLLIDGRNHYPQDIEYTVEHSHQAIRPGCCAVFAVEQASQECLVIIAELGRQYQPGDVDGARASPVPTESDPSRYPLDLRAVMRAIRRAVAESHDVSAHDILLLKTASIPKTTSGKIQRHLCQQMYLNGTLKVWGRS